MANNKRNLSALELAILEGALTSGEKLEDIASRAQVSPDALQSVFMQKGVMLPTAGTQTPDEAERQIYMDILTSSINAADAARQYGFSNEAMLDRLKNTGLVIPLTADHMELYNIARAEGLTAEQAAERFDADLNDVNMILGSAGLSLTGKPMTPVTGGGLGSQQGGSAADRFQSTASYGSSMSDMFGAIPQLPGLRMVRRQANRQRDPEWMGTTDTILTSGRGVTDQANTVVKTLLGS